MITSGSESSKQTLNKFRNSVRFKDMEDESTVFLDNVFKKPRSSFKYTSTYMKFYYRENGFFANPTTNKPYAVIDIDKKIIHLPSFRMRDDQQERLLLLKAYLEKKNPKYKLNNVQNEMLESIRKSFAEMQVKQ